VLAQARSEVEVAWQALEVAMSQVRAAPRSEKVTISSTLEQAFERLRIARDELTKLEALLDDAR
jgi:hypothetical protein